MARKKTPTRGRGAGRRSTGNRSTGSRSGRNTGRRTAPKKKVPLGVLAWTMLLLLILVMFLANRSAIRDVVDRTELLAVLRRSVDNAVGSPPGAAAPPEAPALTEAPEATETPAAPEPTGNDQPPPAAPPPAQQPTAPQVDAAPPTEPPAAPQQTSPRAAEPAPAGGNEPPAQAAPAAGAERRLFFAAVGEAGEIAVTGVTRTIDASASPLTAALQTLFAGPDPGELNRGLITLIPPAATLNRVYVQERIAYVDVSESFRFNPLGREGSEAQLRQLVLSATEFPGVEMVQLLIDGRRVDFLGSEGTYVGEPISRAAVVAGAAP